MKYFFDTEFIEGFKKPINWLPTIGNFNKPYHSIQLISIGITSELGEEYYAISKEYDYSDASDWVKENVILPMYRALTPAHKQFSEPSDFHKYEGKPNKQIAQEIIQFVESTSYTGSSTTPIEFYAYYADYDWVVFCSLFGTMMDLPKGFPMYCRDLKQEMDSVAETTKRLQINHRLFSYCSDGYKENQEGTHSDFKDISHWSFEQKLSLIKGHKDYPKQHNEHNALDDAKWNFELFNFLKSI
jgi:hypothetical protein